MLGGAGFDAPCPAHGDDAVVDRSSWLSTHRTSAGTVVYYRCRCGQPSLAVLASTWRP